MTWKKTGLIACVLCICVLVLASEAKPPANQGQETEAALMRAKLASAQKVVEGLMTQDFQLVQNGADELETICDATQWHAEEDEVYAHYRGELRRTAQKLAQLAEDEDHDGTMYTYMRSVTTCIACHDYCRDVLHVAREDPKLQVIPSYEANDRQRPRRIRR